MNLDDEMDALAAAICKQLKKPDTKLDELVGAFKVLTPYYIARKKLEDNSDDGDDTANFEHFGNAIIKEQVNGPAKPVPGRRRNAADI